MIGEDLKALVSQTGSSLKGSPWPVVAVRLLLWQEYSV